MIRFEGEQRLINHAITLGMRQAIAGIEHSLAGMKPGGYRKVRVSPHLAYRDQGLTNLIPSNAVLIIELWLREVIPRKRATFFMASLFLTVCNKISPSALPIF
jgi:hypothetical protein